MVSQDVIRSVDLGLHSAAASFLWIKDRGELPFLRNGYDYFKNTFDIITSLDSKLVTPYAYTVMVLPTTTYSDRFIETVKIGKEGTQNARPPDWRIPFYTAVTYHVYLKDTKQAVRYFDIAGHTKDVPEPVRRFALNYGIYPTEREKTMAIWKTIYESTDNQDMKNRAEKYIIHFTILDVLQKSVQQYRERFGSYPKRLTDLVTSHILFNVPKDPFGFTFKIYEEGIVGIGE